MSFDEEIFKLPICDICNQYEAVAGCNGYGVCSKECDQTAENRRPKGEDQASMMECPRCGEELLYKAAKRGVE
tara:strand:- start:59 stop:277 length:219 start_codon:yes stop_codon:yes gene_type:complete